MTQLAGNMISQEPVDTSVIDGSEQTTGDEMPVDEEEQIPVDEDEMS